MVGYIFIPNLKLSQTYILCRFLTFEFVFIDFTHMCIVLSETSDTTAKNNLVKFKFNIQLH